MEKKNPFSFLLTFNKPNKKKTHENSSNSFFRVEILQKRGNSQYNKYNGSITIAVCTTLNPKKHPHGSTPLDKSFPIILHIIE
jgi:hypothetical protein